MYKVDWFPNMSALVRLFNASAGIKKKKKKKKKKSLKQL